MALAAPAPSTENSNSIPHGGDPPVVPLASGALRQAVARLAAGVAAPAGVQDVAGALRVEVLHSLSPGDARRAVEDAAGIIEGESAGLVQALVPYGRLAELEAQPGISYLRPPLAANIPLPAGAPAPGDPKVLGSGLFTGEEVSKANAAAWHGAGFNGGGVRIGIVDYFDGGAWSLAQAAGEVPEPAGSYCSFLAFPCNIWGQNELHGVAVAEIIHEMAPDAEIYVATAYSTTDLQAAVDYFIAHGVDIISRSLTSAYDGPGDGTGGIASVIDYAVGSGITWVNSAGNSGGDAISPGSYWRGAWSDADADGWLEFAPGDEFLRFDCAFINGLRWNDFGEASPTDYDAYVYDDPLDAGPYWSSEDRQTLGAPPIETSLDCQSGTGYLAVWREDPGSGSDGDVLEFMINNTPLEYWQNAFSASGPASDTASVGGISVGAVDPPGGTGIAYYSAQGPTNDLRTKPDISAAACVDSFTYAPGCFNGTSASGPVVAGAAALLLNAGVASSPAQVKVYLLFSAATDRGVGGPDNTFGHGELVLPAPPAGVTPTPSPVPTPSPTPTPSAPGDFHALTPARILDTRYGTGGISGKVGAGETVTVRVTGSGGVPWAGVTAVVMNVAVTEPTADSFLTIFPPGSSLPTASNLNFVAGQTVSNLVTARVDLGGRVNVYNPYGEVHVIFDVAGWYGSDSGERYNALTPYRIMDTRYGTGGTAGKVGAGQTAALKATGVGGVPSSGITAVAVSVAVTGPASDSHLTLYPSGGALPTAANLNFTAGQTIANLVVVRVGADGKVNIRNNSGETHVVVDVVGWFGASGGAQFSSLAPGRILDTRYGTGGISGKVGEGQTLTMKVTGVGGVPASGVSAVVINVAVTEPTAPSHLTVYPSDTARPTASNLNFLAGQTVPNLVFARVGADGKVKVYNNSGETHVIFDVVGFFGTPSGAPLTAVLTPTPTAAPAALPPLAPPASARR